MVDIQKIAKLFAGDSFDGAYDYINTCTTNAKSNTDYPDDFKIVYDYLHLVKSSNITERNLYTQKFVLEHSHKMLMDLICAIEDIRNPRPVVKNNCLTLTSEEVELLQKERDKFSLSLDESIEFSRDFHIGPDKQIMFNI